MLIKYIKISPWALPIPCWRAYSVLQTAVDEIGWIGQVSLAAAVFSNDLSYNGVCQFDGFMASMMYCCVVFDKTHLIDYHCVCAVIENQSAKFIVLNNVMPF